MIETMAGQDDHNSSSLGHVAERAVEGIKDNALRLLEAAKTYLTKEGMEYLVPSLVLVGNEAEVHGAPQGASFPVCGYKDGDIVYYC